jgi:hypothetical protein
MNGGWILGGSVLTKNVWAGYVVSGRGYTSLNRSQIFLTREEAEKNIHNKSVWV